MLDALVRSTTGTVTVAASLDTGIDPGFLESVCETILDSWGQHNGLRKPVARRGCTLRSEMEGAALARQEWKTPTHWHAPTSFGSSAVGGIVVLPNTSGAGFETEYFPQLG